MNTSISINTKETENNHTIHASAGIQIKLAPIIINPLGKIVAFVPTLIIEAAAENS